MKRILLPVLVISIFLLGACGAPTVLAPDETPPLISQVLVSDIAETTAIITWTTDELSDSQIKYGTSKSYGQITSLSSELVTSHSMTLTGLKPDTLYHFMAKSRDGSGNEAASSDFTFSTQPRSWTDGRISVVLDRLERADTFPSDFENTPFLSVVYSPSDERINSIQLSVPPRLPKAGHEYAVIHLTLANVKVRHMGYWSVGWGASKETHCSKVISATGNIYQEIGFRACGIRFGSTLAVRLTGSYEFIEGTTIVLIFEVPKQTKLKTLMFVYPFCDSELWETWGDKSIIEWGQVKITL